MKKLIAILASGLLVASAPLSVISCNTKDNSGSKIDPMDAAVLNNVTNASSILFNNSDTKSEYYVKTYTDINLEKIKQGLTTDLQFNDTRFSNYKIINDEYTPNSNLTLSAGVYSYSVEKISTKTVLTNDKKETVFKVKIDSQDLRTFNQVTNDFNSFATKVNKNKTLNFSDLSLGNVIDAIGITFNVKNLRKIITEAIPPLGTIINQPFSFLINFVSTQIPTLSNLRNALMNVKTLTPDVIKTDSNWKTFKSELEKFLQSILQVGSTINFDNPIEVNQNLPGESGIYFKIAIKKTTIGNLIDAIAPDIIHFFNYCKFVSEKDGEKNYSLLEMQYLLSSTTVSYASSKDDDTIMSNVNQDMVTNGDITGNLDNLLFDLFGNVLAPSKNNSKDSEPSIELKAWHDNNNNYSDPGLSFAVTEVSASEANPQDPQDPWDAWANNHGFPNVKDKDGNLLPGLDLYFGYFNSNALYLSNSSNNSLSSNSILSNKIIDLSKLLKTFWEQSFFNISYNSSKGQYWDFLNNIDTTFIKNVLYGILDPNMVDFFLEEANEFLRSYIPGFDIKTGLDINYMYKVLLTSNNLFTNLNNIDSLAFKVNKIDATIEVKQDNQWTTKTDNSELLSMLIDATKTTDFRIKIKDIDFTYEVNDETNLTINESLDSFYFGQ